MAAVQELLDTTMESNTEIQEIDSDLKMTLKLRVLTEFTVDYGKKDGMNLKKLEMVNVDYNPKSKVQKLSLGIPAGNRESKIILLVGATGTGKTTLINSMVNFIFGIEFNDDFRLILIEENDGSKRGEAESQTDLITAYVFSYLPGMSFEYNYILIDTPGFGDARGIQRDREMMTQLEAFLNQNYGIDQVDGVGFVTPASAARLTQTQKYVFDGLSSMFGKDIKDNIHVLATFADAKNPPVLAALDEAGILYRGFYKFNNSAIYANNKPNPRNLLQHSDSDSDDDEAELMCKLFWDMGFRSMQKFFDKLGKATPVSLTLTKKVLVERRKLQAVIVSLQHLIQLGLSKLATLHQERDMLSRIVNDIEGCANYEEEVDVPKTNKVNLKKRECVTNCTKCNVTCHFPCTRVIDSDKRYCCVMKDGICSVCPGKCPWDVHFNMNFRFDVVWTKEKRTVQELLDRYNLGKESLGEKQKVIGLVEEEINQFARTVIDVIRKAQRHVEQLELIALKPNPISTKEYIELLIQSELMEKRPNYQTRIKMLKKLKREVIILTGVRGVNGFLSRGENLLNHFKSLFNND